MPKEKNQHKSAAASDEKFRDFFTTTVADIPAEMVRREEEAAEEHKGLFGRLFGHAKPKQAPICLLIEEIVFSAFVTA